MKKGFTLMEMIAVVIIIAVISLVAIPLIINQVASKKTELSEASLKIIYTANELYINNDKDTYPMNENDTYCVTLETLANEGLIKKPFLDINTGKEIPLNKKVKTVVNTYGEGEYTLVEKSGC